MKTKTPHRLKQKVLPLALTVALAAMAQAATAQTVVISTPTTGPVTWISGNVSVTSSISGGNTGINVATGVGTLTNSGSISGAGVAGAVGAAGVNGVNGINEGAGNSGTNGSSGGNGVNGGTGGNSYGISISSTSTIATLNNATGGTLSGVGGHGGNGGVGGKGGSGGAGGVSNGGGSGGNGGAGGNAGNGENGGNGYGIDNAGTLTTLNNASGGTISGTGGNAGAGGTGGAGGAGGQSTSGNGGNGGDSGITGNGGVGGNGYGISISNTGTIATLNNAAGGTLSGFGGNSAIGGTGGAGGSGVVFDSAEIGGSGGNGSTGGSGGVGGIGFGISNAGTLTTLNNAGTVSGTGGTGSGGGNGGAGGKGGPSGFTVGILDAGGNGGNGGNGGTGGAGGTGYGISNTGTLAALNNASGGTISGIGGNGGSGGLGGAGGVGASGTPNGLAGVGGNAAIGGVGGNGYGIGNTSTITTLNNAGTIIGTGGTGGAGGADGIGYGIDNNGSIALLTNSGLITGKGYAIFNDASGAIGVITNSGVIAGNITNLSGNDLNFNGGTGTTFGTLTGFGGGTTIGSLSNTNSNVVFGTGNLLLNDNINVGGHAVNNNGSAVLQVNQPITITGNYNQAGGTLQVGVVTGTGAGQYGELVVTGNTMMTSGAVNIVSAGYALAIGQRYVVVDTAGTATYGSGLAYSAGSFSATGTTVTSGTDTDLVVTLNAPSTTAPSTTPAIASSRATVPNAVEALAGLSSYTGLNPQLMNLQNAALAIDQFGSSAAANHAGKQLVPTSQAATAQAAAAPTTDVLNIISSHADGLRLAQADGASGVSTGESSPAWGVWGQAFGGHASQDERNDVDGYSANFGGLVLGADHSINDTWRAGGVFSYSNAAINNTGDTAGDTTRVNSYGLMGYASYTAPRWYTNLSAGIVQQRYDTNRAVNLTGFSGDADGSFNGTQYVARAEAGYPLAVGGATITPMASLTYSYQQQNAYTETGGDGAALSVGAAHTTSVDSDLGVKIERELSTSYGELVPELRLAWRHEYDNTREQTAASFVADPTGQTSFTSLGASPVEDEAVVSLGVTLLHANNLSVTARYEIEAGSGYLAQGGTVRLRQLF